MTKPSEKILILDFGSQTAHIIGRRVRQLGAQAVITTPSQALRAIKKEQPAGIILSGGPMSVYAKNAPTISKTVFSLGIPILGICYGMMLTSHLLGGKVIPGKKEYGPARLKMTGTESRISDKLPKSATVWMSHGDEVVGIPKGFKTLGSTETVPFAFVGDAKRKIFGVQFHPEVEHTQNGKQVLKNFLAMAGTMRSLHTTKPPEMISAIKEIVANKHVIGAVSGGVDSTVAGTLVAKAIGKQFTPVYVDNGLMRDDAAANVRKAFANPIIVNAKAEMLKRLKGVTDGEQKRKIIGKFYIEVFEREMVKLLKADRDVAFLMQGTIYSDVIESKGTQHADKIKSHHNVGGLPASMKLQLLEPLRELYKDEVRALGKKIGLSDDMIWKQVFPGPGFAVRIRGGVTPKRLAQAKQADAIITDELKKAGWLEKVYMSFPVMSGAYSTAVKGDGRSFDEVIAVRIIESKDVMTTVWSQIPYEVLQRISSRIVNEVPHVSRVVYDITTKPPATMEWE